MRPMSIPVITRLVGTLLACGVLMTSGCGSDSSGAGSASVETRSPERTFAPLVQLDRAERWRPMGAQWLIDRSALWFADDQGCGDRMIAVGRELGAQRTNVVDWIFVYGLGASSTPYWRKPYDAACRFDGPYRFYAHQHTRPYDVDRHKGLRRTEGFYLDLMDRARGGQPVRRDGHELAVSGVPAYVERHAQEVDGDPGLRLTYWLLFGMNDPAKAGAPEHEGDWERLDVLLQEGDGEDEYLPRAVMLGSADTRRRVSWKSTQRVGDRGSAQTTHPVASAARGDHTLEPSRSRADCERCASWRTWAKLMPAKKQLWYGFGGAWGDIGRGSQTTGPLGPHDGWPPDRLSVTTRPQYQD
jgi:hypothetical protein